MWCPVTPLVYGQDMLHSAAEHIHLLIDGRNKFITRATTYHSVNDLVMKRVADCNYFVEKIVEEQVPEAKAEPEPQVEEVEAEEAVVQEVEEQGKVEEEHKAAEELPEEEPVVSQINFCKLLYVDLCVGVFAIMLILASRVLAALFLLLQVSN